MTSFAVSSLIANYGRVMQLNIFVNSLNNNFDLKNLYLDAANRHNSKLLSSPAYCDAGFDLYSPISVDTALCSSPVKLDFNIVCSASMMLDNGKSFNTGYYMYPRSSLSKTKLRLANSVGIIDAGYRGHLISMFDVLENTEFAANDRLIQICAPGLVPIFVKVVDTLEELGESTARGDGGFGSTGR